MKVEKRLISNGPLKVCWIRNDQRGDILKTDWNKIHFFSFFTKILKLHEKITKEHYSFWRAQFAKWVLIALLNWLRFLILLISLGGKFQSWIAQLKKVDEAVPFTFGTLKLKELLLVLYLWTSATLTKLSWRYGALIL